MNCTGKTGHTKVHKVPHKQEVNEEKECGIEAGEEKAIKLWGRDTGSL